MFMFISRTYDTPLAYLSLATLSVIVENRFGYQLLNVK